MIGLNRVHTSSWLAASEWAAKSGTGSTTGLEFGSILQQVLVEPGTSAAGSGSGDLEQMQSLLLEAARELEAMFIGQVLRAMRRTVPQEGGFLPRSSAEKLFQELLDSELSSTMAQDAGLGLAEIIYGQLSGYLGDGRSQRGRPE